jgi:Tfp pilus assembly PilM family ATPase
VPGRAARSGELAAWLRRVLAPARPGDQLWMACPWSDAQVKRLSVPDAASREATLRGLAVNPAFRGTGGEAPAWRLDYHVVDQAAGAVMAVAARPDGVRAVALAASAAGADLGGVSVAESAVVHAWLCTAQEPDARAVLLEGGHAGVTLVVMDGGEPVGFRRVMFGGRALEERGARVPEHRVRGAPLEDHHLRAALSRVDPDHAARGRAAGAAPASQAKIEHEPWMVAPAGPGACAAREGVCAGWG